MKEEANEIEIREDLSTRGDLNWILLFISPYLFAVAIGIRLTKVTAEIMDLN